MSTPTMTGIFMLAANAGSNLWNQSRTFLKIQSSQAALEKTGLYARRFVDSSGTIVFTPRRCIERLRKFLARKTLQIRFAFDEEVLANGKAGRSEVKS